MLHCNKAWQFIVQRNKATCQLVAPLSQDYFAADIVLHPEKAYLPLVGRDAIASATNGVNDNEYYLWNP